MSYNTQNSCAQVTKNTSRFTSLAIVCLDKSRKDERITFVPFWDQHKLMCSVQHTIPKHKSHDNSKTVYRSVYALHDIYDYIYSILQLIMVDEEPCELYQFDIPGIPSILVKHQEIKNIYTTILDHIYAISADETTWPSYKEEVVMNPAPVSCCSESRPNSHIFFDENGMSRARCVDRKPNSHIFYDNSDDIMNNTYY